MLNENIKAIRRSKGLSQQELAVKLNVVRQTVSKWGQGLSVPDKANLRTAQTVRSFYIIIFARGIYISIKLRRKNITDSLLCLSMTLLFIMFGVNMDPFYAFALALPFYVSFVEYVRWDSAKEDGYNE